MEIEDEWITLDSGTRICVPASLHLQTNYVLKEQGDWFEQEIHFVRSFIVPGMHAIDIGANYGLYTTSIANSLGSAGQVWSFEPAPDTAARLRKTIAENGFESRATIIEAGLSNTVRRDSFYIRDNAEGSTLAPAETVEALEKVEVQLTTLDDCLDRLGWPPIDFLKLDAEGEEEKIIEGAATFFEQQQPVVMFEFLGESSYNTHLLDAFTGLGFEIYYLVPALNVLAPYDAARDFDTHLINLFALKPESVPELLERGVLVEPAADDPPTKVLALPPEIVTASCYTSLPVDVSELDSLGALYREILLAYGGSRDSALQVQQRFDQLSRAFSLTKNAIRNGLSANREQLSTLARVCYDAGGRRIGNFVVGFLLDSLENSESFEITDMFVPTSLQFESIDTNGRPGDWFRAMIHDQLVRCSSHSSYLHGADESLARIEALCELGFASEEMLRRRDVILQRRLEPALG